ncbi:Elongator complex protein 6 [Platanthera guangdongensis]|uniref:Elongator complex protein 6 n=1 Tax=Platanthera guangdongensis TaxID=2320717 RepID=A0ABR2N394_9ASPA
MTLGRLPVDLFERGRALGPFGADLQLSIYGVPGSTIGLRDCVWSVAATEFHLRLKEHLTGGTYETVFLGLARVYNLYKRITKKENGERWLMFSEKPAQKQGEQKRFHFFDILQMEFPCESKKDSVEQGLVDLYSKIQSVVEVISSRDHSRAHISILIDDLSILEIAAHGSMDHVLNFLHYCVTLTSEQNCSLVLLNHEDIYSDIEGRRLLSHLVYLADFIIKAEPLATGIAADVHGQLTVLKKGTSNNGHYSADKASNFHFQLKEHGVDLFFPGSRR